MTDLKVVSLHGLSSVGEVLQEAKDADLVEVLVLGWTKEGQLYNHSSTSTSNPAEIIHLMEAFKFELLAGHSGLKG